MGLSDLASQIVMIIVVIVIVLGIALYLMNSSNSTFGTVNTVTGKAGEAANKFANQFELNTFKTTTSVTVYTVQAKENGGNYEVDPSTGTPKTLTLSELSSVIPGGKVYFVIKDKNNDHYVTKSFSLDTGQLIDATAGNPFNVDDVVATLYFIKNGRIKKWDTTDVQGTISKVVIYVYTGTNSITISSADTQKLVYSGGQAGELWYVIVFSNSGI